MISINIATHEVRQEALKLCLEAILKSNTKADKVNIYLNDYKCPKWLTALKKKYSEINTVNAPEGDLGAAGKFYFATDQLEGVYLTMDDDLIIDRRYIGYLADSAYRYPNCIVGLHGTIYPKWPVKSYYSDPLRKIFYCYHGNDMDRIVDMLGTGCLAFRMSMINWPGSDWFPEPRMTDPYLYVMSQVNKTPLICLTRAEGFVKEIPSAQDSAIWKDVQRNDSKQTELINSIRPNRKTYDLKNIKINYNVSPASIEWVHLKAIMSVINDNMEVVEFGSGKSTQVLSKLCKLTSFEHDEKYHRPGLTKLAKLQNGWYSLDAESVKTIKSAEVIIVDGPIGDTGERYNLPLVYLENPKFVFVDDCHREKDKQLAKEIAMHLNKEIEFLPGQKKIMAKIY